MNKLSCFTYLLILLNGMTVLSASAKAARSNVVLAENITKIERYIEKYGQNWPPIKDGELLRK